MTSRFRSGLLFLFVFAFSSLSPVPISYDSRWTVFTAASLLRHGDINLDEYASVIERNDYYQVVCVAKTPDGSLDLRVGQHSRCSGHWYDWYPSGVPVLTAPLIGVAIATMHALHPLLGGLHSSAIMIDGFFRADYDAAHPLIEQVVASFLLACTTLVFFATARRHLPVNRALWLAALLAFGTSAYSTAGRGLWQHAPCMLLYAIVLYLLDRGKEHWAGLPLALAYTVRPTASVAIVVITLYIAVKKRAALSRFLLGALPVAIVFLAANWTIYGQLLPPYYHSELDGFLPSKWPVFAEALAGNLISPSRGLLIFTPVLALTLVRRWRTELSPWLACWISLQWIAVSSFTRAWWAGASYGPRFFTELSPLLVFGLIPFVANWEREQRAWRAAFVVAALLGVGIHLRGGWSRDVYLWNGAPTSIDEHPERVWSWRDPQFLR